MGKSKNVLRRNTVIDSTCGTSTSTRCVCGLPDYYSLLVARESTGTVVVGSCLASISTLVL
jgi:hypothetical protein